MNIDIITKKMESNSSNNRSRDIEEEMFKASLETEREIARKHLQEISDSFPEEIIIRAGVKYNRIEREKEIHIGRISVAWTRPIYEGSIKGKTVYIYPADDCLSPPKKGRVSYETLSFASLLSTFIPFKIVALMLQTIRGVKVSEASVQRYTESTGQFAIENLEEIIKDKKNEIVLGENEVLIASIDGSSSMINGNNRRSNKKKKKSKKKGKSKKNYSSKKKVKKRSQEKSDFLKEAKVFRLCVFNTKTNKIIRTPLVHSIIRQKEEVVARLQELIANLEISTETTIYTIGDGATWVKDALERLHINTEFLLDFYHASGYVSKVSNLKFYTKHKQGTRAGKKYRKKLKTKGGKHTLSSLKILRNKIKNSNLKKTEIKSDIEIIDGIISYMAPRIDQMDYSTAKEEGRPIGSGFIESACKFIIKQRLCLSGARFSLEDAERIMQLRCIIMMGLWNEMVEIMYRKRFEIKHSQPSSSYEPVIPKKLKAA